jgi:CheY-like chemotaxis protein
MPNSATRPFLAPKSILVIEDDALTAELLYSVLAEETPFHVVVVNSPMEALDLARIMPFDLFLIDYLLPEMDGITLYEQLRSLETCHDVPALMMSASLVGQHVRDIEEQKLYAFAKPFDLDHLVATIKQVLL